MIRSVEDREARTRRRDILIHEDELFAFYDNRVPAEISSGAGFTKWCHQIASLENLRLSEADLVRATAPEVVETDYPQTWQQDGFELPLSYRFEPGADDDGVTVTIPLALLSRVDSCRGEWLVPGLLEQKIVALLRALPKRLRKNFIPVPEFAYAAMEAIELFQGSLTDALAAILCAMTSIEIPAAAWDLDIAPHLLMRYALCDTRRRRLDSCVRARFRTSKKNA